MKCSKNVSPFIFVVLALLLFGSCRKDEQPISKTIKSAKDHYKDLMSLSINDSMYGFFQVGASSKIGSGYYGYSSVGWYTDDIINEAGANVVNAKDLVIESTTIPQRADHSYADTSQSFMASLYNSTVDLTLEGDSNIHVPAYSMSLKFPDLLDVTIDTVSKSYGIDLSWTAAASGEVYVFVSDMDADTSWATSTNDDGEYRIPASALSKFNSNAWIKIEIFRFNYVNQTQMAEGKAKTFLFNGIVSQVGYYELTP